MTDEQRLRALASMRHRGPDGSNVYEEDGLFIGHTRLAIIDLTEAASQPMQSPDGRFVLAYNGEIYNFVELREQIGTAWPWRGEGDTEVLLALLALDGPAALTRLRGMFAFVLWDRQRRSLLAARDALGIKPLYYEHRSGRTLLASELRTLRSLGADEALDPAAVESFLLNGSVYGPRTIFRGVRAVRPGHYLTVDDGNVSEHAYWRPPRGRPIPRAEDELVDEVDEALRESVRLELRSDVPVGVFLSGGIDSSLISSYAAEQLGGELHTFAVGFEADDPSWDETGFAGLVAEHLGTRHERIVVTRSDFEARMEDLVRAIDQPSVDGVNSYFISGVAAARVKVAISGQGGDELFAGYNVFQFASRLAHLLARVPSVPGIAPRVRTTARRLPARVQHNWYVRGVAGVLARGDPELVNAMANPLFSRGEIGAPPTSSPDPHPNGDADLVNALSLLLIRDYLANTLLRDMDAMSMSHSLEVRVPLVDHVLAELALSIPGDQKVRWGNAKAPLRALARRRLPHELLDRPKQGFGFPLAEWLRHPRCERNLRDVLSRDEVLDAGLVDPKLTARELDRLQKPRVGDIRWLRAQRVWGLYVLHRWHRELRSGRSPLVTAT